MIGRRLLHYTITAELGSGGMGRVFLARDERTERRVALKFLRSDVAEGTEARERLVREARAAARLSHPGIVTLFALEECEGEMFLVEEWIEGETLAQRLTRGPLEPRETRRLGLELAAALAHAHAQGVNHRDLKPDNILIATDGRFKIADFGLARLEGTPTLTQTDRVMGTLPYLAPERLHGARGDARADLFSLGAILYEAATGSRAFTGESPAAVMYSVMHREPEFRPELGPSLDRLSDVVHHLLAKHPDQRPASAEAVAKLIEGAPALDPALQRRHVVMRAAAVAIPALAIVSLALWLGRSHGLAARATPTVAVLYFENMADPPDSARIGAITCELLITSLAQSAELNVVSTQHILDALRDLGQAGLSVDRNMAIRVARRAKARRIITGSILRTEPGLVMTAEISDVGTGRLEGAARADGLPGQTLFDVVDLLGARLAERLQPAVERTLATPVAEQGSANLDAHRSFVQGSEQFAVGDFHGAVHSFTDAVRRDPGFGMAYCQLAISSGRDCLPPGPRFNWKKLRSAIGNPSAIEREEGRLGAVYMMALGRGRFQEAARVATEAWRVAPKVNALGDPFIPVADGLQAAIYAHDTARALAWTDSVSARLARTDPKRLAASSGLLRTSTLIGLGLLPEAEAELRGLEQQPGYSSPEPLRRLQFARAEMSLAMGRAGEAAMLLDSADWFGWYEQADGMKRLARLRIDMSLGQYSEALSRLDTLMVEGFISPDDAARLHFYRGSVLERMHRGEESKAAFREFLWLWRDADSGLPEAEEARAALKRLEHKGDSPKHGG